MMVLVIVPSLRLTPNQQARVSGTLSYHRRRGGLELGEAARLARCSPSTWLGWERGVPLPPGRWSVAAEVVGVELAELLGAAGAP